MGINYQQPRRRDQRATETTDQAPPRQIRQATTTNARMVALPAHRKPQTTYRNSQTTKLGARCTRQSQHHAPQRERSRPPNRTTSPLRPEVSMLNTHTQSVSGKARSRELATRRSDTFLLLNPTPTRGSNPRHTFCRISRAELPDKGK